MTIVKIATFSFYHHSDVAPWKAEVSGEAAALRSAISDLLLEHVPEADCEAAIAKAKASPAGEHAILVEADGEPCDVVVWHKQEDGATNFGVGRGRTVRETDRSENIWIRVDDVDLSARESELAALPASELATMLARAEALRP